MTAIRKHTTLVERPLTEGIPGASAQVVELTPSAAKPLDPGVVREVVVEPSAVSQPAGEEPLVSQPVVVEQVAPEVVHVLQPNATIVNGLSDEPAVVEVRPVILINEPQTDWVWGRMQLIFFLLIVIAVALIFGVFGRMF